MMSRAGGLTDDQLQALDLDAILVEGLRSPTAAARLFGDGAVAAAIRADRLDVQPRSLIFLAEIVRRGGIAYAAGLPEPLTTAEQSDLVREWLAVAALAASGDQGFAHWLDAVAAILGMRQAVRLS
jgi:hypothetical protein